jgi:hypothetical protein
MCTVDLSYKINNAKEEAKHKWQKSKIDFSDLFGVGGAGWRCRAFCFFKIQL